MKSQVKIQIKSVLKSHLDLKFQHYQKKKKMKNNALEKIKLKC